MLGTVGKRNPLKHSFALKTNIGYSVFTSEEPQKSKLGDLLEFGDNLPIGQTGVINKTLNSMIVIYFKAHEIDAKTAHDFVFGPN